MAKVFIGLGTNLGHRYDNLSNAINLISASDNISIVKKSSIKETDPVDYLDQPDFLNQILFIETNLGPEDLLNFLNKIEIQMGREKTVPKGPRIIDLDILLYDDLIYDSGTLTLPHPEIKNRDFILEHLLELDDELVDPLSKKMYKFL